ncbi:hypothetical protein [Pseudomonas sp. RIT-To-2]|uniref:hypothetical protein n=1 Tax=Pseudomonas sp. RIT-To-2 TaxID=3462541 RepID=UPI00241332ED
MFGKYPDQATDRRCAVWGGGGFVIAGLLFFFWDGSVAAGLIFFLPGCVFSSAAIFCNHSGFEAVKKVGRVLDWFS